jgi:hypothetical protein
MARCAALQAAYLSFAVLRAPTWRSVVRTHIQQLQVCQYKCLHTTTNAPWYISNRQIHKDLRIPIFSDHWVLNLFEDRPDDMEVVSTSETSITFYETTRRSIPQSCYSHLSI